MKCIEAQKAVYTAATEAGAWTATTLEPAKKGIFNMKRRMNNIFRADGKAFVLAMDHAQMMPSPDLKDPGKIIRECVAGGVDAFLSSYGTVKNFAKDFQRCGIILRSDGGNSFLRKPQSPMQCVFTIEDALRVGADALLCMAFPGSDNNEQTLEYAAELACEADKWGLPLGMEALPYGFEFGQHPDVDIRSIDNLSFACRQACELGADFIKSEFVGGEAYKQVTENCYAPIMVLGGSKAKSDEEILSGIRAAMDNGAKGVIMGRTIYRSEKLAALCAAINAVIHDDASVEEALKILG